MSGWIKLDKTLETDPRVLRMAKALCRRFQMYAADVDLDRCNAVALPGVTLVYGALARLWVYADSHIREDDTLDLGPVEIDELLGIPGFCSAMPHDWLQVLDEHTVELPSFQEHNGVEAIRKAQTQKRVAKHRAGLKRESVTGGNADALPDQTKTRPDQDQTRPLRERARLPDVPRETTGGKGQWQSDHDWALSTLLPMYPTNQYTEADHQHAARVIAGLIETGRATREVLLQLGRDFAAQQDAKGNRNTQFVENPVRHYDGRGKWRGPFALPSKPGAGEESALERIRRLNAPEKAHG